METLFLSAVVVAIAEIGDKTQLLALILATRFRNAPAVILGILFATIANHGIAAWVGVTVAAWLGDEILRWVIGLSFLAMAAWILVPDEADETPDTPARFGPFLTTLVVFFLVEIGDKTQFATVGLAARFQDPILVTVGTTLGMLVADVPAVLLGDVAGKRIPLKLVRGLAAALFASLGVLALVA
ncbi:MAG: TMEM165/GDT1 family protein [Alphaproteobacteria bacterium]